MYTISSNSYSTSTDYSSYPVYNESQKQVAIAIIVKRDNDIVFIEIHITATDCSVDEVVKAIRTNFENIKTQTVLLTYCNA